MTYVLCGPRDYQGWFFQMSYFDEDEIGHLFAQIVLPLHSVHANNILHRDLKVNWLKMDLDLRPNYLECRVSKISRKFRLRRSNLSSYSFPKRGGVILIFLLINLRFKSRKNPTLASKYLFKARWSSLVQPRLQKMSLVAQPAFDWIKLPHETSLHLLSQLQLAISFYLNLECFLKCSAST